MAETSLEHRSDASADVAESSPSHPAVHYNPDAPSEEWGWHGSWREFAPNGSNFLLACGVFCLVMLSFTEHVSHVEDFYFNGIALVMALWIVHRVRSGRKMRREKADRESETDRA